MARYIDADKLNLDEEVELADDWNTAHEIANIVKYAPTEYVAPMVYAKWEDGRCTNCHTDKPVVMVMASVGQGYMYQYQGKLNYCPNCGAKIDEEGKNDK